MGFLQRFGYLEGQSTNNSEALLREEAVIDAELCNVSGDCRRLAA